MDNSHKLKLQLGRKAAYLRRCVQVNELLQEHECATSVRLRVFNLHIRPVIRCSYATFNNMLNEPNPKKQLEQIEVQINEL
jgi:hypothetical protein